MTGRHGNERWSAPVSFARVENGRWMGWPKPANKMEEARMIRRANEIEEAAGRDRWPGTEWAYEPSLSSSD